MIDRRRFLAALVALGGLSTLSGSVSEPIPSVAPRRRAPRRGSQAWRTDASSVAPWTEYFGAVQDRPVWASVQRGGHFADASGKVDAPALRALLAEADLLSWPPPQPSQRTQEGVAEFMTLVAESEGSWWRDRLARYTAGLVAVHRDTPRKVIGIHLGNEIDAADYRHHIEAWCATAGLAYPHPSTDFGDGGSYRRDHLGYYVEYFLAPAVEGIRRANRGLGTDRIPIVLGSIVGARQPFVRNDLIPSLLDYRVEGTFAPTLAGAAVKDLVDHLSVHYVLTPRAVFGYEDEDGRPRADAWRLLLDDLHDRWVRTGTVAGVWHTEEGGTAAQRAHRHGILALRVFARTMSWSIERSAAPEQLKVFGWYKTPPDPAGANRPREETSWAYALGVLHAFIGGDTPLTDRSAGAVVHAGDLTETYVFETVDRRRRVVLVTPAVDPHQGEATLRSLSVGTDGWRTRGDRIEAAAHHFTSGAEAHRLLAVQVTRSADERRYDLVLPEPVALNPGGDMRTLMITLRDA